MKNFQYAAPRSEADVLELLSPEPGKTEVLAGGTDLVGLLRKMVVTPDLVVNIMQVDSLMQIERLPDGYVAIGATVTLDDVLASPLMADYGGVCDAILGVNSMALQGQGTIGGELCQRPQCWQFRNGHGLLSGPDSGSDTETDAIFENLGAARFVSASRLAPALIALEAQLRIIGPAEEQEQFVAAQDFYRIPRTRAERETILAPNQIVTHIILPPAAGRRSATYEVRQSAGPDFPLAAAAVSVQVEAGVVREARVVLGQVAPIPWVSDEAATALVGAPISADTAETAGEAAVARATPLADNVYKVQLAKVAVRRAVLRAAGMDTGGF